MLYPASEDDPYTYILAMNLTSITHKLGVVAESVDGGPRKREVGDSIPGRVKPMT